MKWKTILKTNFILEQVFGLRLCNKSFKTQKLSYFIVEFLNATFLSALLLAHHIQMAAGFSCDNIKTNFTCDKKWRCIHCEVSNNIFDNWCEITRFYLLFDSWTIIVIIIVLYIYYNIMEIKLVSGVVLKWSEKFCWSQYRKYSLQDYFKKKKQNCAPCNMLSSNYFMFYLFFNMILILDYFPFFGYSIEVEKFTFF